MIYYYPPPPFTLVFLFVFVFAGFCVYVSSYHCPSMHETPILLLNKNTVSVILALVVDLGMWHYSSLRLSSMGLEAWWA